MENLSNEQIAAIVFNETRSLSGTKIVEARVAIAHAIINAANSDRRFPVMASRTARPGPGEAAILAACSDAVATARREVAQSIDPTDGGTHFNFRKNSWNGKFQGHALKTSHGPLDNSYPTSDLPASGIYANTYE